MSEIGDTRIYQYRSGTWHVESYSNVLTKDNTTAFNPTADYHPATVKYVNDNGGSTDHADLDTGLNFRDAGHLFTQRGTGAVERDYSDMLDESLYRSVRDYGAKGDYQRLANDTITTNSTTTITTTSAVFVDGVDDLVGASGLGKLIIIIDADGTTAEHITTIASVTSTTEIEVVDAVPFSTTNAQIGWSTDDTLAIQAAIDSLQDNNLPGTVYFPNDGINVWSGHYWITDTLHITGNNITLKGDGDSDNYHNKFSSDASGHFAQPADSHRIPKSLILWAGSDGTGNSYYLEDYTTATINEKAMVWFDPQMSDPFDNLSEKKDGGGVENLAVWGQIFWFYATNMPDACIKLTGGWGNAEFKYLYLRKAKAATFLVDSYYGYNTGTGYSEDIGVRDCEFKHIFFKQEHAGDGYMFWVRQTFAHTDGDFHANKISSCWGVYNDPTVNGFRVDNADNNEWRDCQPDFSLARTDDRNDSHNGINVTRNESYYRCGIIRITDDLAVAKGIADGTGNTGEWCPYNLMVDGCSIGEINGGLPVHDYTTDWTHTDNNQFQYSPIFIIKDYSSGNYSSKVDTYCAELPLSDGSYTGDSGSTLEVDWKFGQYQKYTVTENVAITFVDPLVGVAYYHLRLLGLDSYTVDFSGISITWETEDGNEPSVWSADETVTLFWDGTNYRATVNGSTIRNKVQIGAATSALDNKLYTQADITDTNTGSHTVQQHYSTINQSSSGSDLILHFSSNLDKQDNEAYSGTLQSMRNIVTTSGAGTVASVVILNPWYRHTGSASTITAVVLEDGKCDVATGSTIEDVVAFNSKQGVGGGTFTTFSSFRAEPQPQATTHYAFLSGSTSGILRNNGECFLGGTQFDNDGDVHVFGVLSNWTDSFSVDENGDVIANKFTGPLTGNVTGNVTGSSGSCTGTSAKVTIIPETNVVDANEFLITIESGTDTVKTCAGFTYSRKENRLTAPNVLVGTSGLIAPSAQLLTPIINGSSCAATGTEINTVADGATAKNSHTHTISSGGTDVTASAAALNQLAVGSLDLGTNTLTDAQVGILAGGFAQYFLASEMTALNNTIVTVTFDDSSDTFADITNSSGAFTTVNSGTYKVTAQATITNNTATDYIFQTGFRRNGVTAGFEIGQRVEHTIIAGETRTITASSFIPMTATQLFYFRIYSPCTDWDILGADIVGTYENWLTSITFERIT